MLFSRMGSVSRIQSHCIQVCKKYIILKIRYEYFFQIAKEVLNSTEDVTCFVKPLADGLNFMSDAYFVEVKSGGKELSLFSKVDDGISLTIKCINFFH